MRVKIILINGEKKYFDGVHYIEVCEVCEEQKTEHTEDTVEHNDNYKNADLEDFSKK